MKANYILSFDLGTTGNKAALFDMKLNLISQNKEKYSLYYPKPGCVEQNAEDFWKSVIINTTKLIEDTNIGSDDIRGIIFDSQGNCTIPIDREGHPLIPCINWLDVRAANIAKKVIGGILTVKGVSIRKLITFLRITGGAPGLNGKDPISHILWIKKNLPQIYDDTFKFLSVKDYIIYKCTNNAVISRDLGHTSWLMDTHPDVFNWSRKLLKKFKIEEDKLPEIKNSTELAGKLTKNAAIELELKPEIPVYVGSSDLIAAAIGSGAVNQNQVHINIGTAAWVATHVNHRKKDIIHYVGPISAVENNYLCISKQETGAVCLDWIKDQVFRDELNKYEKNNNLLYNRLDEIVSDSPPGANKLLFTPWMYGERSPINDPNARGGFFNLNLDHDRADLMRSIYEGVAYNLKWSLFFLEKLTNQSKFINIIGGGARSELWCQILADILKKQINQMENPDLGSVRGSAAIALVGLGGINDLSEIIPLIKIKKSFMPQMENNNIYNELYNEFIKIYKRNKKMFKELNST